MEERASFGVVDYCVFIATLVISFGIGIATAFIGNKSPEEYLLGNRSMRTIPVALSLLTTFISAINITGYGSEVYAHGIPIALLLTGGVVGIVLTTLTTLPVLFPLKMTSINEYVEMRFGSPILRICMGGIVFVQAVIFMGICVYATSLALTAVVPLDFKIYIFMLGSVCTIYSTFGGIRAVIWTDVFQFFITVIGLVIIIVAAAMRVGFYNIFSISKEGGRLEFFNLVPNIYKRHDFYFTFLSGVFMYVALFGIAQVNLQRVCAVPTLKDATRVICITAFGMLVLHAIIIIGGLAAYANYAGCDPILEGKIKKKDEIFPYFVIEKLSFIPGLAGIFVATIIATTLSTFSSVVNAQTAIIWEDGLSKLKIFSEVKPTTAVIVNKILTFIIGFVFIGVGILTSMTQNMIQLALTICGIAFGAMYGVFILGIYFPVSNVKGCYSGLFASVGILTWIFFGSIFYQNPPENLPLSTDMCEATSNLTLFEYEAHPESSNVTVSLNATTPKENESFPLMYLYNVSYTLYAIVSPLLCIIVGLIVSYITGATNPHDVPPELMAPFLRKFYAGGKKLKIQNEGTSLLKLETQKNISE